MFVYCFFFFSFFEAGTCGCEKEFKSVLVFIASEKRERKRGFVSVLLDLGSWRAHMGLRVDHGAMK